MDDLWLTHNPSDVEQSVEWDRVRYGMGPRETRLFPEYLADHFAKHVAHRLLRAEGRPYDEVRRLELLSEIKVRRAGEKDAPYPEDPLLSREAALSMKEDAVAMTLKRAGEQSAKLDELIGSYERRFASLKAADKALRARELALGDSRT